MSPETIAIDSEGSDDGGLQQRRLERIAKAPVVLEARGVTKTFQIPDQKIQSFKERAVHPFRRQHFRELTALNDIDLDIRRGEFFGIVGRNGSGKSTLLKILASIYAADSGQVRMAGTLAPFIELGVGFNPDVTAIENVVLNGVMMGLTPREARRRVDAVFEFAELEEFKELRLKNYSSGMTVRLAFAVMIQADTDILLIDEVLAVGDASFQQKCADVFHGMRDSGKTVVLVTHDMSSVETYCDRAMLLHDGDVILVGDPDEVAKSYFRINFEAAASDPEAIIQSQQALERARCRDPRAHEDRRGAARGRERERGREPRAGRPDPVPGGARGGRRTARTRSSRSSARPATAPTSSASSGACERGDDEIVTVVPGERIELSGTVENPLAPGRYVLSCWISREAETVGRRLPGARHRRLHGLRQHAVARLGLVEVDADVEAATVGGGEDARERGGGGSRAARGPRSSCASAAGGGGSSTCCS